MKELLENHYTQDEIEKKREQIRKELAEQSAYLKSGELEHLHPKDLELLFWLYDDIFLHQWFKKNYTGTLQFAFSGKMTRAAGKTVVPSNIHLLPLTEITLEIRLSVQFFFEYQLSDREKKVGGIVTHDALHALMLVFEHELCHAIEFLLFKKSSCRGERFRAMAYQLFGHVESTHELPTHRELANKLFGIKVGSRVSFIMEGKELKGIVSNIRKRAVVMVPHKKGNFVDATGKTYHKYYVPINHLTLIK